MRILKFILFLLIPLLLSSLEYVPNQLIFKTAEPKEITRNKIGLSDFDQFLDQKQINKIDQIVKKNNHYFVATFQNDIDWENIRSLSFGGIEYFQPNYLNRFYITPNDPLYSEQLNDFENCNIPQAWNYSTGNEEIIVSVVDSGIHFDHPDLQNNVFINQDEIPDDGVDNDGNGYIDDWRGWDFVHAPELSGIGIGDFMEQDNDPTDELNHGTHISGIIAADASNNEGVCGICWQTKLLSVRSGFNTTGGLGYLQDDDAAAGIIYSADMGADIINLSWGDVNFSQIIADACEYAYQQGSIIVASAGNEGSTTGQLTYPAKLSSTISVGAVNGSLNRASFSSYGPQLDLVAPGFKIISTYDVENENYYGELYGTSMSAPYVAASISLLLATEPNLNYGEVRARLLTTTIDLGDDGYDNYFGNGLLDTYAFLTSTTYPEVSISYPLENSGMNESFDIIGTVLDQEFWRYSVQYTSSTLPMQNDWQNVNSDILYYYQPVNMGSLAHFELGSYFPAGDYIIKVELTTNSNDKYNVRRKVHIDQTPPVFDQNYAAIMKRYDAEIPEYFLQAVFDESVSLEINIPPSTEYQLISTYTDSIQICKIPEYYDGSSSINLRAVNISGLETFIDEAYYFQPDDDTIDLHSFSQTTKSTEFSALSTTYDFDNNGLNEIVVRDDDYENPTLSVLEYNNGDLITKHIFDYVCWPHDIGNTNSANIELLGVLPGSDNLVVYEAINNYPENIIFQADNCYGGSFADYNGDGFDELVLNRNVTVGQYSYRVLQLYQRQGNIFNEDYTLFNNTPTSSKNIFSTKIACGDLDQDQYPDILAADKDGDIMIFEKEDNNFEMVWYYRLPVANASFLRVGDFNGDGINEFCAGGYTFNATDLDKSFSFFEFFVNSGSDNEYTSDGYVAFDEVQQKNSISIADLDGDTDQEIVIGVPPNLYIVDNQNDEYIPIWKGENVQTSLNVIAASSRTETQEGFILANREENGEVVSSIISKSGDFTGPASPKYFNVTPMDSTTIELQWQNMFCEYFNIYRKIGDDVSLIDNTTNPNFTDENLATGDTVFYQVTAYDHNFSPAESLPTNWKSAIPLPVPEIEFVKMVSQYSIKVKFDQQLNQNANNISFYSVTPDIGNPISVNMFEDDSALLLRFLNKFEPENNYMLSFHNLSGISGVPITSSFEFPYQADTEAPRILTTITPSFKTAKIIMSEKLNSDQAENLSNITFVPPALDDNNKIEELIYNETIDSVYITLKLESKILYSNQSYFIRLENIEDLSGNEISNNGNKCHFNLTGNLEIKNLRKMQVYPNPLDLHASNFDKVNFINLPMNISGKIWIYNINSELIFSDDIGPFDDSTNSRNFYSWNCQNYSGKQVSSGMYYYFLKMKEHTKKGKFVIIN